MIASATLFLCTALLSAVTSVSAHGFLASVTINGKEYPAWDPDYDPYAQPIPARVTRVVPNDGPVTDLTNSSLACNVGGEKGAALVANAPAGSQVKFVMNRWPDDHKGPVTHYMAECTNGDCTTFNTKDASWFKVDASGFVDGVWATDTLIKNDLTDTMTIPAELKPGQYLIRHELIALHSLPAQMYPECVQVKVTGSGTTSPSGSSLVKIPGLYADVKFPDIWADGFKSFTIPGPVPAFGSSGSSSGGNNTAAQPTSTPSSSATHSSTPAAQPPAATPSKSTSGSQAAATGQCRGHKAKRFQRHAAFGAKRHH